MSDVWLELWTRPGHASFGRVHDFVPAENAGFSDGLNKVGGGNMTLPTSWAHFDDLVFTDPVTPANSTSSLVRVYSADDPTVPIFEWLPEDLLPASGKDDQTVEVGGTGFKGVLGYARLEPWDWDGSDDFAPQVPDWVFGGPDIIANGDFETQPFPNGGFEDGDNNYWQVTQDNGFLTEGNGVAAVFDPANAQAGDYYGLVNPGSGPKSGVVRTFSGLTIGSTYTITGFLQDPTASGDRFRAGITAATSASHANAYEEDGYWWAELDNSTNPGSSDGTWQTFTLTFEAAETSLQLVILYDDPGAGPNFWVDTWDITGDGVGLFPWEPRVPANTLEFRFENTIVDTGLGSLAFQVVDFLYTSPFGVASYGQAGIRQPVTLKVGQPYTMSVRVRQDSGVAENYRLIANRQSLVGVPGSPGSSYMNSVTVSVPSGVWTTLSLTFTADVTEGWFEVRYVGDAGDLTSPLTYVDNAHLYEGLPKTTVGDILTQLYDDATVDHAGRVVWEDEANPGTPYLTLDFDASLDSDGVAWADAEIGIRLTMRMSYSQIMAEFSNSYGYEYRIIPDDPELGTWLWQVYNPGGMMTDYTAAASPAIQGGATDTTRSLRRFLPANTDVMIEGVARVTGRDRDTSLLGALGRIEGASINREASDLTAVGQAAAEATSVVLTSGASYAYTLIDPQDEPLSAYQLGDLLNIVDPPEVTVVESRFVDLTVTISPLLVEWAVQFGSASLTADAKLADAVERLVNKFEYPDELGGAAAAIQPSGKGGVPRVVIASAFASDLSKSKADYIATGSDDGDLVEVAIGTDDGEVRFTEGNIEFGARVMSFPNHTYLTGAGMEATSLIVSDIDTLEWTFSTGGLRFLTIEEIVS